MAQQKMQLKGMLMPKSGGLQHPMEYKQCGATKLPASARIKSSLAPARKADRKK